TQRSCLRFIVNFGKAQAGLWLRVCLVVGLGVAASTYLSGLISFLAVAFVYLGGILRDFIKGLAEGTGSTGGPIEASYRLALRDFGGALDETSGLKFVLSTDNAYRLVLRVFANFLPDVDRFDFSSHVAEGFNIGSGQLALTGIVMAGYLLVCALGAYYLMKWREIASDT